MTYATTGMMGTPNSLTGLQAYTTYTHTCRRKCGFRSLLVIITESIVDLSYR